MEKKDVDDLYDVLDELNSRIEEIFNTYDTPVTSELIISKLNEKAQDFIYDFESEIEKLELIEMNV